MANQYEDKIAQMGSAHEPQRQYQFKLVIDGLSDSSLVELSIKSAFPPSEKNEEVEVPFMNSRVYVAGKHSTEGGTITLHDYMDKKTAEILMGWRYQVYNPKTGTQGYASVYKKTGALYYLPPTLDPASKDCRRFNLQGMWPSSFKMGNPDYSSTDLALIELAIRIDKFIPDNMPTLDNIKQAP